MPAAYNLINKSTEFSDQNTTMEISKQVPNLNYTHFSQTKKSESKPNKSFNSSIFSHPTEHST